MKNKRDITIKPKLMTEPVYGPVVYVFIGCEFKHLEAFLRSKFDVDFIYNGQTGIVIDLMHKKTNETCFIFWVYGFSSGIIAHEVFHLVDSIFTSRGVNYIKNDENEAYAYYIQYWTSKIINYGHKLKEKKHKSFKNKHKEDKIK